MDSKKIGMLVGAFVLGMLIMGLLLWSIMPSMMLSEHKSTLGFEETVAAINASAIEQGWKVPAVHNIQGSLHKAGHTDMGRATIIELCQPDYAYAILKNDDEKIMTAMMPCRIGVYEKSNGEVYVSTMNVGIMGMMFGGNIATVMGQVSKEDEEILQEIVVE